MAIAAETSKPGPRVTARFALLETPKVIGNRGAGLRFGEVGAGDDAVFIGALTRLDDDYRGVVLALLLDLRRDDRLRLKPHGVGGFDRLNALGLVREERFAVLAVYSL
jgi:hypothetical protein